MKIALAVKRTALERYQDSPSPSLQRLLDGNDPTVVRLRASHDEHHASLQRVMTILEGAGAAVTRVWRRREPFRSDDFDLVVTVGGDGTFLGTSHNVGGVPMLGINSAPSSSVGFFCGASGTDPQAAIEAALANPDDTIDLARMSVTLNGTTVTDRVLNDALYCHLSPAATSRYLIDVANGGEEEHKSSGFWIGPPAGSTAAQRSAGGSVQPLRAELLQLVVREPYTPDGSDYQYRIVTIPRQDRVLVRSKSRRMRMYLDGPDHEVLVGLGDSVEFRVSNQPLRLLGITERTAVR